MITDIAGYETERIRETQTEVNVKAAEKMAKLHDALKSHDYKRHELPEQRCGKKTKYKKLDDSIYKEYYDRMHKKLTERKSYSKRLYRMRSSTVEPVLGTLINFLDMRRVNARGIELANKHVLKKFILYMY